MPSILDHESIEKLSAEQIEKLAKALNVQMPGRFRTKPDVEIVSHCWKYASMLQYQLSSLILYPPRCRVEMTVFTAEQDQRTIDCVKWFAELAEKPPTVTMRAWVLPKERLFRRAIGRNVAALATQADIVWFTDVDYLFGEGCLDALADKHPLPDALSYPKVVRKQNKHAIGDAMCAERREEGFAVVDIDHGDYHDKVQRRAIGGIQIVRGDTCRRLGYVPNSKWQKPADTFQSCRGDIAFRRAVACGPGVGIDVPNVFRLRHSDCGRKNPDLEL